jgi:hypothetical protein
MNINININFYINISININMNINIIWPQTAFMCFVWCSELTALSLIPKKFQQDDTLVQYFIISCKSLYMFRVKHSLIIRSSIKLYLQHLVLTNKSVAYRRRGWVGSLLCLCNEDALCRVWGSNSRFKNSSAGVITESQRVKSCGVLKKMKTMEYGESFA